MAKPIQTKKDPATVAEVDEALAAVEAQYKNPPGEGRSYAAEKAKDRRNWIAHAKQEIGRGKKSPRHDLVPTHSKELEAFEHDAELNVEYNRLYQLRHRLERKEGRAARVGRVPVGAAGVSWASVPGFAAEIALPELPAEGVPAEVIAALAEVIAEVNKAVKKFVAEPAANVGGLGDLNTPITVKDVEAIHAARRTGIVIRINNAKSYVLTVQAALAKLIAFDAEEVTRAAVACIEEQARALAAKIEADTVTAGADPEAAKDVAANAPKVKALLASVPLPGNAVEAEARVEALLVERADGAREALGQLLAALG